MDEYSKPEKEQHEATLRLSTDIAVLTERITNILNIVTDFKRFADESARDRMAIHEEIVAQKSQMRTWFIVIGALWSVVSAIFVAFIVKFLG